MHTTAYVLASCEQIALQPHLPLLTLQLSKVHEESSFTPQNHSERQVLPVQATFEPVPVLVYPVLQVHFTAFVVESCEQAAFGSQPPLFTVQLSKTCESHQYN